MVGMMVMERLFEIWVALFEVCWAYGRVPSLWRVSVIILVPKKQGRGVCDVNTFQGISLTSLVSKLRYYARFWKTDCLACQRRKNS